MESALSVMEMLRFPCLAPLMMNAEDLLVSKTMDFLYLLSAGSLYKTRSSSQPVSWTALKNPLFGDENCYKDLLLRMVVSMTKVNTSTPIIASNAFAINRVLMA